MTVRDLIKQCGCKHATSWKSNPESTTVNLLCKKHDRFTGIETCQKCKERETK